MKPKKKKIIEAIMADRGLCDGHLVTSRKVCGHTGHCALGALLFHAGMTNRELAKVPDAVDSFWCEDEEKAETKEAFRATTILRDEYGLDFDAANKIMQYNDEPECPSFNRLFDDDEKPPATKVVDMTRAECVIGFVKREL